MATGTQNNYIQVINSAPANTSNTSTPEDLITNATQGIIYVWSAWTPYSYTPLSSGNYWTYFLCKTIAEKNYAMLFAMASGTLYKYNFNGSAWVQIK